MPNLILPETFTKVGSHLISGDTVLIIHHRKKFNATKPELYLMYRQGTAKPVYLSGMYLRPDGSYVIESNRQYWTITLTDTDAQIKPLAQ